MTVDEALMVIEELLQPKRLNDLQQLVFCRSWSGQSYAEIAEELGYDVGYIKDVGSQLWHSLSEALGEKVSKKNLQTAVQRYQREQTKLDRTTGTQLGTTDFPVVTPDTLEFPSGSVPLHSLFYIERSPIETQCWAEVSKPGSLIRIRASRRTGKTSLMHRIVAYAKQIGLKTATLNLQQADRAVFEALDKFLRWFCANISQQLELPAKLDDYWDEDIGSKVSCTLYMQRYVLKNVDTALVLALDEVNRLFEYPDLASDFLPLLRSWYEDASEYEVWQKLRLVVVHATEVYIPLNLNQSPFNVGLPIKLPEFSLEQVQQLALRHGLSWASGQAGAQTLQPLVNLIGGHPYLVRLALYRLGRQDVTLEQLLQEAATPAGIYAEHLRSQLTYLQAQPELAAALKQVLTEHIHLEAIVIYKLESLGLITLQSDQIKPSCELYRKYFQEQLM